MRILVCGGRDFSDKQLLFDTLDRIDVERPISLVIHGAAHGADSFAGEWAMENLKAWAAYPADWTKHGKAAGAIRNRRMLVEGRPDLVVAMPGGRGTANMIKIAHADGVEVMEIEGA
jgi:SLOG family YspA-like protein